MDFAMKQGLLKDTLVYGLSAIISRGLSFIVLPIYTRILSPADYGALDMITVVGSLANLIVALEVTQGLVRFLGDVESVEERRRISSTALLFTLAAYASCFLVAMLLSPWITSHLLGDPQLLTAMQIGLGIIAVNGCFFLLQNQLRYELKSIAYAQASLLYAILVTGLGLLLGYGLGFGLEGVLLSQLIAAALSALMCLWHLRGTYRLVFDNKWLRTMLLFSMPLVPSGLATFLTLYANRLLLNATATLEDVGLFGVAARIAGIVSLLIVGLQSSLTPWIYANYRDPATPARLAKVTEWFTAAALAMCLTLGVLSHEIMQLLVAPQFVASAPLVMPIAVAAIVGQMYIFFPGIAIAKRTNSQLIIFVITALISVGLNWLLIPMWGVGGAAIATLLASLAFIGLWFVVSQRHYPVPVRVKNIGVACILFAIAAASANLLVGDAWARGVAILVKLLIVLSFIGGLLVAGLASPRALIQGARSLPWPGRSRTS